MAGAELMGDEFTIEQLASAAGMTVRTIRSHVTRGLLPPPRLRGRTGYYGDEHVRRLQLIAHLQEQGFNLASITRLVEGLPDADLTVELYQRAMKPWFAEQPVEMTEQELAEMFRTQPDKARLLRLRRAGVIEDLGDGRIRVVNPSLLRIGARSVDSGFDVDGLLAVLAVLVKHARSLADALVAWFLDTYWESYVAAGRPPEQLPELTKLLGAVQPMAAEGVLAAFGQAMSQAVEASFKRIAAEEIAAAQGPDASTPATG